MFGKNKVWAILIAVLLVVSLLSGCGNKGADSKTEEKKAEKVVIKMGTKMPPDSVEGKGFQKFADLVKERSSGRIEVQVFPSEQLGDTMTQIDNVVLGSQDMYCEGGTYFSRFAQDFNMTSVPYLFSSNEMYQKVVTGPIQKELDQELIKKGLRIINDKRNFIRGPYRVLVSKKPIKSLDDIQGLRLRAFDSEVYMKGWNALGANPIVIAWNETYLALKQNVVDAVTSPVGLVYSMKFTEVAPYVININEFPQDVVMVINNKKFESLSKEDQQLLIDAANYASDYSTGLLNDSVAADIEKMKKEHNAQFSDIDVEPFKVKLNDVFYQLENEGKLSKGLVDKILNTK